MKEVIKNRNKAFTYPLSKLCEHSALRTVVLMVFLLHIDFFTTYSRRQYRPSNQFIMATINRPPGCKFHIVQDGLSFLQHAYEGD